ncbi:MAG: 50S ribosomal protein L23 [Planctomycetota bacterium]|nr:50S ribosomal protein L23 [Planctomycetota bacterium]
MSIHKAAVPVRNFGPKLDAHQVIIRPLVTEKGNRLTDESRTYVFEVNSLATKPEIKQAAEVLFNIKISTVRTLNVRGKGRGYRFRMGRLSHWKKAYISLQPDSPALDLF